MDICYLLKNALMKLHKSVKRLPEIQVTEAASRPLIIFSDRIIAVYR